MTASSSSHYCQLCSEFFVDTTAFHSHQSKTHYYCALCECGFPSDDLLQYHLGNAPSHNQVVRVYPALGKEPNDRPARMRYQGKQANDARAYDSSPEGSIALDDTEDEISDSDSGEGNDELGVRDIRQRGLPNEDLSALEEIRAQDLKALVQLWRETVILQQQQSMTYKCHICLEEPRLDSGRAIRLPKCNHIMCRECLRMNVQSDLDQRRYPIRCPDCIAEQKSSDDAKLSDGAINLLYLSDRSLQIYKELQLEQLAVKLLCNRCERVAYVLDREFRTTPFFNCTFCEYRWCGQCSQAVERNETGQPVPHSCDGAEEFGYLRSQRGWRVCPNLSCRATVEKTEGCNHLECRCGTHFCYGCGVPHDRHTMPFPCQ